MSCRQRAIGATLVLVVALLSACDPGWGYRVPGGRVVMDDGRNFELEGPSQTSLRVHASLFTSSLWTKLTIKNDGSTPIAVRPDRIRVVVVSDGVALGRKRAQREVRCAGHDADEEISLAPGESCQMNADFEVSPDPDRLKRLTLIHDGLDRHGVAVPLSVTLEKD